MILDSRNTQELKDAYKEWKETDITNFGLYWNSLPFNQYRLKDIQKSHLLNNDINFGEKRNKYVQSLNDSYQYPDNQYGDTSGWLDFINGNGELKCIIDDNQKSFINNTISPYQNMWFEIMEDKTLICCIPNQANINIDVKIEERCLIIDTNNL